MKGTELFERVVYTTAHLTAGLLYEKRDVSLYIDAIPEFVLWVYEYDADNETDDDLVDQFIRWHTAVHDT